jgi:hypothetical protein
MFISWFINFISFFKNILMHNIFNRKGIRLRFHITTTKNKK